MIVAVIHLNLPMKINNKTVVHSGTVILQKDETLYFEFQGTDGEFKLNLKFANHEKSPARIKLNDGTIILEGWAGKLGIMTPYDFPVAHSKDREIRFSAHGTGVGDHISLTFQFTECEKDGKNV